MHIETQSVQNLTGVGQLRWHCYTAATNKTLNLSLTAQFQWGDKEESTLSHVHHEGEWIMKMNNI